ncbi:MAG: DMT family transporter [Oscillibacter sp.]|nr:DMT family transporter [Oscillibacter sp.]
MNRQTLRGVLCAVITILVWGSTFVFSKLLLETFTPAQIMLARFLIAYATLLILHPRTPRSTLRDNLLFLLLGLFGNTVYFFLETYALTYTAASNVSIIIATVPLLTAILSHFAGTERFHGGILLGFLVAFSGVVLVVLNGAFVLKLSPRGDLLSLGSAASWAVYSVLSTRYTSGYDSIFVTRRMMLWGAITTAPFVLAQGVPFPFEALREPAVLGSLLFLGVIGSAVCYLLWTQAFRTLGAVMTNNFIYVQPFITIVAAHWILGETISPLAILGAILITAGVILSRRKKSA